MAGGGKVYPLVLLMALLTSFTAAYAARSHPAVQSSLNKDLMSAFGVSRAYKPCCFCSCTRVWPPEANTCFCGGVWEGTCPSACNKCICNESNMCSCEEIMKYNDCMSNACPSAGEGAQKGI